MTIVKTNTVFHNSILENFQFSSGFSAKDEGFKVGVHHIYSSTPKRKLVRRKKDHVKDCL